MSLITGRLRRVGQGDNCVETGTSVVLRNNNMALTSQADTASKYNCYPGIFLLLNMGLIICP